MKFRRYSTIVDLLTHTNTSFTGKILMTVKTRGNPPHPFSTTLPFSLTGGQKDYHSRTFHGGRDVVESTTCTESLVRAKLISLFRFALIRYLLLFRYVDVGTCCLSRHSDCLSRRISSR